MTKLLHGIKGGIVEHFEIARSMHRTGRMEMAIVEVENDPRHALLRRISSRESNKLLIGAAA